MVLSVVDTLALTSALFIGLRSIILAEAYLRFVLAIVSELLRINAFFPHSLEQYPRP